MFHAKGRTQVARAAFALIGAAGLASSTQAGIIGHQWVEVDNSVGVAGPTHLSDGTLPGGVIYRTFDLYLQVPDGVQVLDSGFTQSQGSNTGIEIQNTSFFQVEPGGVSNDKPPLPGFFPLFPQLEFDSYVAMGDLPGAQIGLAGLTFTTSELTGTWFATGGSAAEPTEDGLLFAARFTVQSSTGFGTDESASRFLGGVMFLGLDGGDNNVVITLSNAFATTIPAPGGAAMMGLLGLTLSRRRRG